MNKKYLLITSCLFLNLNIIPKCCDDPCYEPSEHSFSVFRPRTLAYNSMIELALTNRDAACAGAWYTLGVKPLLQKSYNERVMSEYFLPNRRVCVELRQNGSGDINPIWLNLMNSTEDYDSTVCLCPRRTVYGLGLTFFGNLGWCIEGLWLGVNTVIASARHDLRVSETNQTSVGSDTDNVTGQKITDACAAFNQPAWKNGRLRCCSKSKFGLEDIQVKLGYMFLECATLDLGLYGLIGIPTGNSPGTDLFAPAVGSKHFKLGGGINGDLYFFEEEDSYCRLRLDLKYIYGMSATECRSFDLCENGDWSRYLLVVPESDTLDTQAGINFFTLKSSVRERSALDCYFSLDYKRCAWHLELGYNFWWRQSHKITLKEKLPTGYGIADLAGSITPPAVSASTATIAQSAATDSVNAPTRDSEFVELTTADLNLKSGGHPEAYSNTIFGSLAYECPMRCGLEAVGISTGYEFASRNILENWSIWATVIFNF